MQIKHILAVIDEHDEDLIAIRTAQALARKHAARLQICTCVEPPRDLDILARLLGKDPSQLSDRFRNARRTALQNRLDPHYLELLEDCHVLIGKAYIEIVRFVAAHACDVVVKKAEPLGGAQSLFFTSTDQHLLRKCPCPVWLQTPQGRESPERIVAAVDLDLSGAAEPETMMALNLRVVETACQVAHGSAAEVVLLHAWEAIGESMVWAFGEGVDATQSAAEYVNEVLASRQAAMSRLLQLSQDRMGEGGPRLLTRLRRGAPEAVIEEFCRTESADVLVMGTVGRTGLSGVLIGNTAENLANSLHCPLLAIKPEGFVSPLLQ